MSAMTGGCSCGAVRWEATSLRKDVTLCHCAQCRRTSGHYWAATHVNMADFRLTHQEGLQWYTSSQWAKRGFCNQCGASLFYQMNDEGGIGIAAGSVDTPTALNAAKHIFTDDKGDYYELADDLPKVGQY